MYTLIIGAVVGLIIGIASFFKRSDKKDQFSSASSIAGNCVLGIFIGAFIGGFVSLVIAKQIRVQVTSAPTTLVAMRSADGVSGAFIFGTGGLNNGTSYNFMTRSADGSMVPGSLPANGLVHITEVDSLKTTGEWTTTQMECDRKAALYDWAICIKFDTHLLRQDFRVPVGTVVQQFKVQ